MSIWGDILGIGGDIAGAFVGMPWIGTAATSVAGALNSSGAANTAANQQVAGAQAAQNTLSPFYNTGVQALGRLGSLYGLGGGPSSPGYGSPGQGVSTGPPPIPAGSGVLPPGNPSTGQLTEYGPGWAAYPMAGIDPRTITMGQMYRSQPQQGSFTNTVS